MSAAAQRSTLAPHDWQLWWLHEYRWPRDTSEYVFLARAVRSIGAKLHGDKWTGREPATLSVDPVPMCCPRGYGWQFDFARLLLLENKEHSVPPRVIAHGKWGPEPGQELTADEWRVVQPLWRAKYQAAQEAFGRFHAVRVEIAEQCSRGALVSVLRPVEGGQFSPIPDWHWNTERLAPRFAVCQLNPRDPFSLGIAGDGYGWIFLTRASLDAYLTGGEPAAVAGSDDDLYWRLQDEEPKGAPKQAQAWRALRKLYPAGRISRSMSFEQIADKANRVLDPRKNDRDARVSGSTVERLLTGKS
jgi:hypothetical protein